MIPTKNDFESRIDRQYGPAYLPWVVCLSAALFFFYEFVQMSMFNAISTDLMADFNISAAQFGNLSATYFYMYVLFLLPAGVILDRVSTRSLILCAMTLCVASTYLFAWTHSYTTAMIAHALTGAGGAFNLLSCLKLASRWFPPKRMAIITGLVVTMAMLGGMIAQTPFAWLAKEISWRHAMMANGTLGVGFLIIISCVVHDYPRNYEERFHSENKLLKEIGFWRSIGQALRNAQVWLAGLYTSFINLPVFLLGQTWGVLYLMQVRHLDKVQASNVSALLFFGLIVGPPIFGFLSDRIGRRRRPMIIGGILSLATILAIMYLPLPSYGTLSILFFLLGFFTSSQVIGYPVIAESSSHALTATSLAVASVLIMLGGTTEPLFGWLLDWHWDGAMDHGVRVFSASSFNLAFWMMPIAFMFALVCTIFIRETFCKAKEV